MIETVVQDEIVGVPNSEWYRALDARRNIKLARARDCAAVTIPSILPDEMLSDDDDLRLPYSSDAARGVNRLASKILQVLLPLNNQPFFRFVDSKGIEREPGTADLLETLSNQVYKVISRGNLRETMMKVIQHLLVVGDVLLIQETLDTFRIIRLDQYVVSRDVDGFVRELGYITWVVDTDDEITSPLYQTSGVMTDEPYYKYGYKTVFVRVRYDEQSKKYIETRQFKNGQEAYDTVEYDVLPYMPLRWVPLDGENYSRSLVEENLGDIKALEAATESLIHSMAASSTFWMAAHGPGLSKTILEKAPIGSWVEGNPSNVGCITPATALRPQIDSMLQALTLYRQKIAEAFLNAIPSIPSGDRVTAAAIRMIGSELEAGLGAPYVNISRQAHEQIIKATLDEMFKQGLLDPKLDELLKADEISVSVVTGLQSLSRDNDLINLMQMGEVMRGMPPEIFNTFRWSEYAKRLVSALGFDPTNWVRPEEEIMQMQQMQQQRALQTQLQATAGNAAINAVGNVATQAATQEMLGGAP